MQLKTVPILQRMTELFVEADAIENTANRGVHLQGENQLAVDRLTMNLVTY